MSKGILLYALNNEHIDYVELAYYAAKKAKKFIDLPIAIVTDSADWLYTRFPNCKEVFSYVIRLVDKSGIQEWFYKAEYPLGSLVYYEGTIWKKTKEGPEVINVITENHDENKLINLNDFVKVYQGIDIDKWYPNLPYLKGQHVWFNDNVYICETGYTEGENFTNSKYKLLIENVKDLSLSYRFEEGQIFIYNRNLYQCLINLSLSERGYDLTNLEKVYLGIDIDKWYPNLPYLKGQHVWYKNKLYRCHTDYNEKEEFDFSKYEVLIENVKNLSDTNSFTKGDILLYNRMLWIAKISFDMKNAVIRNDLWENTGERFYIYDPVPQYRKYHDGAMANKRLKFKNDIRVKSFELSPFDETLVIDSDFIINNHLLKYCWEQSHDFLIHKNGFDLSGYRYDPRLHNISDKTIDFYWATVFFFRKNKNTEIFFDYLGHIQDNWNYYRHIYQIQHALYRNDYAFSIAIHVMNGYQKGSWAHELPGKMYYTIDKDILLEHSDTSMKFLIEKEKYTGQYTLLKSSGINVHVMNKFSLSRVIRENENV